MDQQRVRLDRGAEAADDLVAAQVAGELEDAARLFDRHATAEAHVLPAIDGAGGAGADDFGASIAAIENVVAYGRRRRRGRRPHAGPGFGARGERAARRHASADQLL